MNSAKRNIHSKKKSAFTLVEMAMVVLIIGTVIGLFSAAYYIVDEAKLSAAQTKTDNSPVLFTNNLILWLETTHKNSIDEDEAIDGRSINTWYDINPKTQNPNNATSVNAPNYNRSSLNGLPGITFNGSDNYMTLTPNLLPIGNTGRTYFIVTNNASGASPIQHGTDSPGKRIAPTIDTPSISIAVSGHRYGNSSVNNLSSGILYVASVPKESLSDAWTIKINGSEISLSDLAGSAKTINTGITYAHIGTNGAISSFFNGTLYEMIIFDRNLKTKEIEEIEKYLSKKWGIDLG